VGRSPRCRLLAARDKPRMQTSPLAHIAQISLRNCPLPDAAYSEFPLSRRGCRVCFRLVRVEVSSSSTWFQLCSAPTACPFDVQWDRVSKFAGNAPHNECMRIQAAMDKEVSQRTVQLSLASKFSI